MCHDPAPLVGAVKEAGQLKQCRDGRHPHDPAPLVGAVKEAGQLKQFTVVCNDVDLSAPTETSHGRYWYNLHVVLVTTERYWIVDRASGHAPRLVVLDRGKERI